MCDYTPPPILATLKEIRIRHNTAKERELNKAFEEYYQQKFPNIVVYEIRKGSAVEDNGVDFCSYIKIYTSLSHDEIRFVVDQYNNFSFRSKVDLFPIPHVHMFLDILCAFFDGPSYNNIYVWRSLAGFLIRYFEETHKYMNVEYLKQLFEIEKLYPKENKRSGLYNWLFTDAYGSGGSWNRFEFTRINKKELMS